MATTIPFTFSTTLSYPPDDGEPAADRSCAYTGNFEHEVSYVYNLSAGTQAVDFGSIATVGIKALLIDVITATAPVMVHFNGSTDGVEVAQGGHVGYTNPVPTDDGVLSMNLICTSAARVRVTILG